MKNHIEVQGLTKYYGDFLAVDQIDFSVKDGEIFGFLGPNGAGKTTTQRMLTSLLEPSSGRISIDGMDLDRNPVEIKRSMGLVPEESNVYTELTGWDNLMFTARLYLVERSERALRAQKLLEDFGLWEKRDVKVEDYSKGMRRRLSIAMAIIHQPSLLFLDEPTPGLDAESTRYIRDLIRRLNGAGTTIFLTTHQIEEANQLCDRVAILKEGKIVAIDTPENLKGAFQRVQSVEVSVQEEGDHLSGGLGSQHPAWSELPGVISVDKRGDKWRLFTDDPSALLPLIIDNARDNQLRITSLNTIAPSLEDVFLDITSS